MRCKSTVNVVIKLPTKQAPSVPLSRARHEFLLNDCVTSRMGLGSCCFCRSVAICRLLCEKSGCAQRNKCKIKQKSVNGHCISPVPLPATSLSLSSLWLLLCLCLKSPIRIVQSRFAVFLNVNLRQQLLLLSAFGFIMTRKIMQCLCCCCCSLLFFLLLLHTDCKTFILYLLGVLVLRLIIFLLLLLLLLLIN